MNTKYFIYFKKLIFLRLFKCIIEQRFMIGQNILYKNDETLCIFVNLDPAYTFRIYINYSIHEEATFPIFLCRIHF
jgi:hypothetical protein